jgi:stage V sporulation protein K
MGMRPASAGVAPPGKTPALKLDAVTKRPASSGGERASSPSKTERREKRAERRASAGGGGAPNIGLKENATAEQWLDGELQRVVGLERVKEQMRAFLKNLRLERRRQELGLPVTVDTFDMVFYGNPGTGKTSVARLIPEMLRKIGILKAGAPFLEVGRGDLVGAVIGATEERTGKIIKAAKGGVLFIDEAYTLTPGGDRDFGIKALETIMQTMTSTDTDRPIFIFAGYLTHMETFLGANPGMARRIAHKFHFQDFTTAELATILRQKTRDRC